MQAPPPGQGPPGAPPPGMMMVPPSDKMDNILKLKQLILQLRESLSGTLRVAAHEMYYNNSIDSGAINLDVRKNESPGGPRFDKAQEEFFAICDHIENNLLTSMECQQQGSSSLRYLPINVHANRMESNPHDTTQGLSYPQYLKTVRSQIGYLKEIHDILMAASQSLSSGDWKI